MLKAKKRISRREIKEDKLVTTYFRLLSKYDENKRIINGIGIGLFIAIVAGWFYINNRIADNTNAYTDLGKVMKYFDEGNFQRAIDGVPEENIRGLQSIVETYSETEAVELTKLYLANSYYELKDYNQALQYYRETDLSDKTLMSSAIAGTGSCLEAIGDFASAAAAFEKAASKNPKGVLTPDYLNSAASNYISVGKKEKGVELLKRLKRDHPNSAVARDADRLIAFANN